MDIGYDPSLMQRIFHYAMIAMVWGINQIALESDPKPPRDDGGDVAKASGTGEGMESSHDVEEVEQCVPPNDDARRTWKRNLC